MFIYHESDFDYIQILEREKTMIEKDRFRDRNLLKNKGERKWRKKYTKKKYERSMFMRFIKR